MQPRQHPLQSSLTEQSTSSLKWKARWSPASLPSAAVRLWSYVPALAMRISASELSHTQHAASCKQTRHRTSVRPALARNAASEGRSDTAGGVSVCGRATLDRPGTRLPGRWQAPTRLSASANMSLAFTRCGWKQVTKCESKANASPSLPELELSLLPFHAAQL